MADPIIIKPDHYRLQGFSLITASVVLAVAGLIFVSMLPGDQGAGSKKALDNVAKLERVEEAMRAFMAAHGRLPCPADGQYAFNTQYFGVEAANPGSCTGGTPSAPLGPDAGTTYVVEGVIPTKTIGLPDEYAVDANGHRFGYVVDKRVTSNTTCLTTATGGIAIKSSTGGTVLANTMHAFISFGASGYGAYPANGLASPNTGPAYRINSGSTDGDMQTNAGVDAHFPGASAFTYNTTNFTNVLVQKSGIAPASADTGFDDVVWYRNDTKNTCALGPLSAPSSGSCSTTALTSFSPSSMTNAQSLPACASSSSCTGYTLTCTSGALSCSTGGSTLTDCEYSSCAATCSPTANQGGGTLNGAPSGNTAYPEYTNASDATCTPQTLTCTNGALSCSTSGGCNYNSCVQTCALTANQGGGTLNGSTPGNTETAYTNAADATCTAHTLTCAGTSTTNALSCSTGSMTDCAYSTCTVSTVPCTGTGALSWVGTINESQSVEVYQAATVASPGTCNSQRLTCTGGSLTGSTYTNQTCTVTGGGGTATDIWVVDFFNERVQKLNSSGAVLLNIGAGYNGVSGPIAIDGTGNGQFQRPWGVAVDSGGNVWVADYGNGLVQKFSSSGAYLSQFGSHGTGNGQFYGPTDIAVNSSGNLWVADYGNNRVEEFNSSGSYLSQFGSFGTGNGQFSNPWGIAIDSSGNIWVADFNWVQKFNSSGSFLLGISGISEPAAIAFDASGNLWVTDSGNGQMCKFNSSGTFLSQFSTYGPDIGSRGMYLTGTAVDSSGNVWVADEASSQVQEYNSSGTLLSQLGTTSANGQFYWPEGIAFDGSGNVWVTDPNNCRVEKFNSSGSYLAGIGAGYNGVSGAIGSCGSGNGQFYYNSQYIADQFDYGDLPFPLLGIAVDSSANIWVVDYGNNRVQKFNSSGSYVTAIGAGYQGVSGAIGSSGSGNGQFGAPSGIAIDSGSNVWVTDGNFRVQKFNSSGVYQSQFGSAGSGNGLFNSPQGIAIDSGGNIWVGDYGNHRVQKFNSSGTWQQTIPGSGCAGTYPTAACTGSAANGQFSGPQGVAIDSGGNIWVTDIGNFRVQKFNSSGSYLSQFGSIGNFGGDAVGGGNGLFDNNGPSGIAVDSSGNIWAADNDNNRLQKFNSSGSYLSEIDGDYGPGQFYAPQHIITTTGAVANCTLPWGGTLANGGSIGAYATGSVTSPTTCPSANSLSCSNGVLSCSTGSVAANCEYATCANTCALPWGGTINSGSTATGYSASAPTYPTTCPSVSATLTCTNGTLSPSGYNYGTCGEVGQPCTLTANQNSGSSGSLNDTQTATEYTSNAVTAPAACTAHTMTCNNSVLSCSTGSMSDCVYGKTSAACTVTCALTAAQGGGTLPISGSNTASEYPSAEVASPATCSANTLTCTAAGLSCSTGTVAANCADSSCTARMDDKILGPSAGSFFGGSVAVGDINGDGYADLIIGAPLASPNGLTNAGSVYVLLGSATGLPTSLAALNGTNGFELDGVTASDEIGQSVATGSTTGGSYADIIIEAGGANSGAGYTYVVFGNASGGVVKKKDGTAWSAAQTVAIGTGNLINGTNGVRFDGQTGGEEIGSSVAAGDFNGDGKKDIIIGSYLDSYSASYSGSTYVIYGASPLLPGGTGALTFSITSGSTCAAVNSATGLILGQNVSGAGIPAGTTISVAPGTACSNGGGSCSGATCITLSNAATATEAAGTAMQVDSVILSATAGNFINGTNGIRFDGAAASYYAGFAVAAGDIDGVTNGSNNVDDIIIGAPQATGAGSGIGYVYVVYGHADSGATHENKNGTAWSSTQTLNATLLNGTNGFTLVGGTAGDEAGSSVAVGDINNDGYADIIIGAPSANSSAGYTYVVFGGADVSSKPYMKNGTEWAASNSLVPSIATTGVLNGLNGVRFDGQTASDVAGFSVAAADFNGDNIKDLIIGAANASYGASVSGSTYVIFGKSTFVPTATTVTTTHNKPCATVGSATGLILGQTVSSTDIPVNTTISAVPGTACGSGSGSCSGATCITLSANASATGAALAMQVVGNTLNTTFINGTNGFRLDDNTASELSGTCLAAGDFNGTTNSGHNLNGIAIGAPSNSPLTGAVFIINGSAAAQSSTNTMQ